MKGRNIFVVAIATAILGMSATVIAPSALGASTISPNTLATAPAHIGAPFLAALSFENGATWSVTSGQLPPGLTLGNGQITGVPTEGGAYTFIVRATGSSTVSRKYTILVNLPTSTGYDARMHSVIFARDAGVSVDECVQSHELRDVRDRRSLGESKPERCEQEARVAEVQPLRRRPLGL